MPNPFISLGKSPEELSLLSDSVQSFVLDKTDHRRSRALRATGQGFDASLLQEMAGLGWLGILVPESHGGLAMGYVALAATLKELGRGLLAEPFASAVVLAGEAIRLGDNAALQERLLPRIAAGQCLPALAWMEQADGSDALDFSTTATYAVQTEKGALLSGCKRWVAGGPDGYVVSARCSQGLALYWVEASAAGLSVRTHAQVDGTPLRTLLMESAEAHSVVARPDVASMALAASVDAAAAMTCAELCGVMEFAMDTTLDYLRIRVQYDKVIGSFQALQHKTVDLYVQQELALSATLDAVRCLDDNADATTRARTVSRAKARCSDAALRIARESIQLHGAIGFTDEHDIGLYLKRALVAAAACGNADQHRRRFASIPATTH